jgi:2-oxoglutarate decarboxylase
LYKREKRQFVDKEIEERAAEVFGPNVWLVDEMYRKWQENPKAVGAAWREFFQDYRPSAADLRATSDEASAGPQQDSTRPEAREGEVTRQEAPSAAVEESAAKEVPSATGRESAAEEVTERAAAPEEASAAPQQDSTRGEARDGGVVERSAAPTETPDEATPLRGGRCPPNSWKRTAE